MTDRPVLQLNACIYEDIAKNTRVFNLDQIEYYLWVRLGVDITSDCFMYEAAELDKVNGPIIFSDTFERKSPMWIRVRTDNLNKEIGLHIYRLSFVDTVSDDTFSLFFGYIIQDDNPAKPYVYMDRDEDVGCDQKHNHAGEGATRYVNSTGNIC